jgi:hypothetical protein
MNVVCGVPTTVEASRPRVVVGAVSHSTTNLRAIAPDQLGEVAPGILIARLVIWILSLLLMPAVDDSASELQPLIVVGRGRTTRRQVAATAILD